MRRHGDPGREPAAAGRHHDRANARALLDDLDPDRTLARDDVRVVDPEGLPVSGAQVEVMSHPEEKPGEVLIITDDESENPPPPETTLSWERLAGVVFGEATACDLPGSVRARRRGRVLRLGREG